MTDTPTDVTPPEGGGLEHRMLTLEASFQSVASKMGELATSIGSLVNTVRKDRRITRMLVASVILDLLLSAGFFVNLHRTDHATHLASVAAIAAGAQTAANKADILATCVAANETRREAVTLWSDLLANPPGAAARTPAVQTELDSILALVNKVYAQRSCAP